MMKPNMEFFDSPIIYIVMVLAADIPALCLLNIFIGLFDALDVRWWIGAVLIYGGAFILTVGFYPFLMSKIHLSPEGIQKSVFQKFRKQNFAWEEIQDCRIYSRPNGYSYIIVATIKIEIDTFSIIKKDKAHFIFFTFRQEAFDYIKAQLNRKSSNMNIT